MLDKIKDDYKSLGQIKNLEIDKLVKLYKKDRYLARIVYMNDNKDNYSSHRLALFTKPNGDFNLVYFKKTFGINKNNIMYSNEKRVVNIIYKKNKFHKIIYVGGNKYIRQLTLNNLTDGIPWGLSEKIIPFFIEKFTWLRHMHEHTVLCNMSFNSIVNKKLFSLKKAMSYEYGVPYPVAKILHNRVNFNRARYIKTYLPYIKNIENFREELLHNDMFDLFYDSIKMARVLDKKVNCSWSNKRLKNEHDKWAEIISNVVFTHNDRKMSIGKIYEAFSEYSGYKLLTTTKEMAIEGKKRNHCVASYINKVDNHISGIYSINDYTLELKVKYVKNNGILIINQFRGYKNKSAPKKLYDLIYKCVEEFNKKPFYAREEKTEPLPF